VVIHHHGSLRPERRGGHRSHGSERTEGTLAQDSSSRVEVIIGQTGDWSGRSVELRKIAGLGRSPPNATLGARTRATPRSPFKSEGLLKGEFQAVPAQIISRAP